MAGLVKFSELDFKMFRYKSNRNHWTVTELSSFWNKLDYTYFFSKLLLPNLLPILVNDKMSGENCNYIFR